MDRSKIKAKAYAVFSKDGKILMHEIFEHGKLIAYRIPGGHVEFGERSRDAAIREIHEELSAEAVNVRLLGVDENIFVYEGKAGHEITFVYAADFKDKTLYDLDVVPGFEPDNGQSFPLHWIDPLNPPPGLKIFPEGLKAILQSEREL